VTVLFIARHFTYFRSFESVIEELARRGHRVHLAADREEAQGGQGLVERLAASYPGAVTTGFAPLLQWGRFRQLSRALRLGLDYLRYSDPRYDTTPKIRERAFDRTPWLVLVLARLPFRGGVRWVLERLEQAVPGHAGIEAFVRGHHPDVMLITPLIELGSPQLDYVMAARSQGVRSALCVWSWDHLSSKALIRVVPDKVIVWNEVQRAEAMRFHGIGAERVLVTGAQSFDRWFDRQPSRDRETFVAQVGLPAGRPILLYVGSALFKGSPSEARLAVQWAEAVRRSPHPQVRDAALLIRPHPQRQDEWADPAALEALRRLGAVVWGSNPVDAASRADYFDSMFHASAVVGLNTSALLEAAIVDRPVLTLLLPEFHDNQEGTFHFHYLLDPAHGFLNSAPSLDEHTRQLAGALSGAIVRSNRRFVDHFVRPKGAATPVFADAVEQIARDPSPRPRAPEAWLLLLRPVIYALVLAGRVPLVERIYWNPKKLLVRHS